MKVDYSEDKRVAFFDGYKFRKDLRTGYYLSTKNTGIGRRERLHCYVWRYYNGEIPKGYHIHHVSGDKEDNEVDNLQCIRKEMHSKYHGTKNAVEHYEDVCRNLSENAAPRAAEWHKSEEGRAWHAQNLKKVIAAMKEKHFTCAYCGKDFFKKPLGVNKYCSNNCKANARRKSGVDNEIRQCAVCGGDFSVNKYSSQRCCSTECGYKLRWDKKYQAMREGTCI